MPISSKKPYRKRLIPILLLRSRATFFSSFVGVGTRSSRIDRPLDKLAAPTVLASLIFLAAVNNFSPTFFLGRQRSLAISRRLCANNLSKRATQTHFRQSNKLDAKKSSKLSYITRNKISHFISPFAFPPSPELTMTSSLPNPELDESSSRCDVITKFTSPPVLRLPLFNGEEGFEGDEDDESAESK